MFVSKVWLLVLLCVRVHVQVSQGRAFQLKYLSRQVWRESGKGGILRERDKNIDKF